MQTGSAKLRDDLRAQPETEDAVPDLGPDAVPMLARLEQVFLEHARSTDRRIMALSDAVGELRQMLGHNDASDVKAELLWYERRLAEVEAAAQQQVTALSQALTAIRESTIWRATAPLRRLGSAVPPERRIALRRLLRRTYWLVTPHRNAMRKQWVVWAPQNSQTAARLSALSEATCARRPPLRRSYGPTATEQLDIYPTAAAKAPIFVMIHGGGWRGGLAKDTAFAADTIVGAGAHYIVPDFIGSEAAGGDLRVIVDQVLRSIAWVYRNAASFGGDPARIYLGGHSSGGHLCAAALVTDWQDDYGLPADLIKGGLLMSGIYDLHTVRTSKFAPQLAITDEIEQAMSPQRRIEALHAPIIVTCGGAEAPEFRRQSRAFVAAATAAGKPAELIEAAHFGHLEMAESLGSPYGPNGSAALRLMALPSS
jgi:arylformamidase